MIRLLFAGAVFACICLAQPAQQSAWRWRVATDPALTGVERIELFFHDDFATPQALFRSVGPAIGQEIGNKPAEWNRTAEGFGKRVGVNFVLFTSRDLIRGMSTAALGHDPRYQRCACTGKWQRTGHAFGSLFVAADQNGKLRFDPSNLISAYGSGYIGAILYPNRYSETVKGSQLGHDQAGQVVVENLLLEFGPEIRHFWRHTILRKP